MEFMVCADRLFVVDKRDGFGDVRKKVFLHYPHQVKGLKKGVDLTTPIAYDIRHLYLCHNLDPFLRREGARVRATLCNSVQWRSARDV